MKLKTIKRVFIRLFKYNATPHGIALGVAIGVCIAVLPVYGLHTILMILAAILVRSTNKIAIFIGTNISLPPTLPFITWGGYELGRSILKNNNYPALSWSYFRHLNFHTLKDFYYPLFVGSFFMGLILAVLFYLVTFFVVAHWGKGHKK
ncbi:MAG: DUF2062 domain-containing protein [Candidatus Omnitrophica bacterium]|nr:DUF2062 domain-containing protein [Candidatus Omnitrophota bacterium]